jgi:Protein of unknown function (DUF3224)
MKRLFSGRQRSARVAALCFAVIVAADLLSTAPSRGSDRRRNAVTNHAEGTFDVKVAPATDGNPAGSGIGRYLLDKQFHGDLEGTSKGEMLGASTSVKGSAGYVAIEQVTGTLKGRAGSFILQHSGTMTRGALKMTVTVVPDSGTGQLTGIAGKMTIRIADGKHFYDFQYTLPEKQ